MANIIDYVEWRGDLNLNKTEFNEIDSLILNRFSYFPLDNLINKNEMVSIKELSERFKKADKKQMRILWKDDADLFPIMGNSKRFGEMLALEYINKIDPEQEKQFSAITVILPDDTLYISYRGTDNTLIGWKEDFNISFKSHIASQISAKKYLENIAKKYPYKKIRIGGHSKGGNLAVYASVFVDSEIQKRIINVYNNDGPGFHEDIINTEEYKRVINKVTTYIPQDSIFGMLLNHEEKYTIVQSNEKMLVEVKKYINQNMYDEDKKSYVRNAQDKKMDISILGAVTPFNVFKAKEKKVQNTEYENYAQCGFEACSWEKDNLSIKDDGDTKGTKADYIFKVYATKEMRSAELLTSVVCEMKNESPSSTNKKKNADHYAKLDKDRMKKNCEYAY